MKKKLKRYNVVVDLERGLMVDFVAVVENPAMQKKFLALSKQEVRLKSVNEEKRELVGVVLEPNKPIYRNNGTEEYEIIFSEESVKKILLGFQKNGYQNNSNIGHEKILTLDGVTFYENWIVEDEKNDKSNFFGLDAKKGSWVTKMKVDDDTLWNEFIKTGALTGFP